MPSAAMPFKLWIRDVSKGRGYSDIVVNAITIYGESVFYTKNGTGTPTFNDGLALKKITHLAITPEDGERARKIAEKLYRQYIARMENPNEPASSAYAPHKALRYKRSFAALKRDIDKGISNTNEEDLAEDPVYRNSNDMIRGLMRRRQLTLEEYQTRLIKILEYQDIISLPYDAKEAEGIVNYANRALFNDPNAHGSNWDHFTGYVIRLLSGDTLSRVGVMRNGIDPETVLKKAEILRRTYHFNMSQFPPPMTEAEAATYKIRGGQNPIAFEEGWQPRRN
ncbi:MAG: hypothetical protein HY365_02695 [Candidatus Aenigmarchaeota archaeon]|nr:hypothetical protein [Candidatus Aenigmarchaeota archaeon]